MRARVASFALCLATLPACTHDFDSFEVGRSTASGDGSAGGGGGSGSAGGTSGSSGGASAGGATSGAGGGTRDGGGTGASGGISGNGGARVEGGIDAGSGGAVDVGGAVNAGGAADGGGAVNAGGADAGLACSATQKICGAKCVANDAPATGCGAASCAPCSLANTQTAECTTGACAPLTCSNGFGDCNGTASDGCEHSVSDDPQKCGSCIRGCAGDNVESRECAAGRCTSSCKLGHANCNRPPTGPDDGCEIDATVDSRNCGSCGNDCTQQNGKTCVASMCHCAQDTDCRSAQSAGSTCNTGTGVCSCNAVTCKIGESCRNGNCSCNGAGACTGAQTCCRSPQGCLDLTNDPGSCGACGRACAPGFVCIASGCHCSGNPSCDAGSPGTCAAGGLCHCGATTCAVGQRCLPDGTCG